MEITTLTVPQLIVQYFEMIEYSQFGEVMSLVTVLELIWAQK